ncbi:MAG: rRNA maturation RNase YbeY [Gammaproteobacteria bacterium]|nr:rRNA maturation RNase YbeY [Gammaproteobacteria bacterium]
MPMNLVTAPVGVDGSPLTVELQDACGLPGLPQADAVRGWLAAAVQASGDSISGVVTLRLVDEDESATLNARFRDRSGATNVLSFPYAESTALLPQGEPKPFGDIVICAVLVPLEAVARGVSETAHWAHLVIHGMLHLLGYDHLQADEQLRMEELEITALATLGFADPYDLVDAS